MQAVGGKTTQGRDNPTSHNAGSGVVCAIGTVPARRNHCGFTMVELLLVMTVMVAAISVAGPTLANFFRGRTLDSEARRLLALTHAGQSRAVAEGIPMRLWVDVEKKAYGLKEEPGWDQQDPKEVEFDLDKDLKLEIVRAEKVKMVSTRGTPLISAQQGQQTSVPDKIEGLPQIRFLPDRRIDSDSPKAVRLTDRDGISLWIAQSRNGMGYEIRNQLE